MKLILSSLFTLGFVTSIFAQKELNKETKAEKETVVYVIDSVVNYHFDEYKFDTSKIHNIEVRKDSSTIMKYHADKVIFITTMRNKQKEGTIK